MGEGRAANATGHDRHDPLQVAEAVDRGGRLAHFMQSCNPCSSIYADLSALVLALQSSALPARPRDFMLSAADAHRLRSAGWRALWRSLGSARDAVTRPLAMGFTTLGLAGLLLTAAPSSLSMLGPAAASPESDRSGTDQILPLVAASPDATAAPEAQVETVALDRTSTLTLSVGLLAAGGGLFLARHVAMRERRVR